MCGIAGVLNRRDDAPVSEETLRQMLALLRHRGPDEYGIFRDGCVGMTKPLETGRLSQVRVTYR